jgi:hypothetical protein
MARGNMRANRRKRGINHRDMAPPPLLPNHFDNAVIDRLQSAPFGTLNVDKYTDLLKRKPRSEQAAIKIIRSALVNIYEHAADVRNEARTLQYKIKLAEASLSALWKAVSHLSEMKLHFTTKLADPVTRLLASDVKGADEPTVFSETCSAMLFETAGLTVRLHHLIRKEKEKPSAIGERKKRLRVLTEALAAWWVEATGKTIAPYVQTKPLKKGQTFIVRRTGSFVEFAVAIFSEIDRFTRSEVVSTIINVAEHHRRRRARSAAVRSE